jgi:para-aminobenzoate synthetase/4-amino-4-deoxychorismate lyase
MEYSLKELDNVPSPAIVSFSSKKTDKKDVYLYHKTTNRKIYEEELKDLRKKGEFDVIFTNKENEITEGAVTNIIIQKEKNFFTPPVSCGILNGVFREHLLRRGEIPLKEKILFKEDLVAADQIYMINSVRKMMPVTLSYPANEINPSNS